MKRILLKKVCFLTVFCLLISLFVNAQTTYTYSGIGNWTDVANWSPSYPGTIISSDDTVIIQGDVTIVIDVINKGLLTNNGFLQSEASISNEGTLNNNGTLNMILVSLLTNTGNFTNNTSGILTIDFVATLENNGILNVYGFLTNIGTITNNDYLDNPGYMVNYDIGHLINSTSGIIRNDDSIENYGAFYNNGIIIDDGPIFNYGVFFGEGTHERSFINDGTLSPGNAIGIYAMESDYYHTNTASLNIELESITSFDLLDVTDLASLNGTLNISLLDGFTPNVGDTFTILTAGEINGTFTTINLPSDYTWNITYTATEVILEVAETLSILDTEIMSFMMYPNPAVTQFTINLKASVALKQVTIYNTLGQAVLTSKEHIINTSKLASGSYIVEVITNQGKSSKKLIIE